MNGDIVAVHILDRMLWRVDTEALEQWLRQKHCDISINAPASMAAASPGTYKSILLLFLQNAVHLVGCH